MKKLLAILLALVMCMTLLPLAALAEEEKLPYYVVGTLPGLEEWKLCDEKGEMMQDGDVWKAEFKSVSPKEYYFKITDAKGTWDNNWGNNGENIAVNVSEECDVTITFDPSTKEIRLYLSTTGEVHFYDYYVAGNIELTGADWDSQDKNNKMTQNGELYEKTFMNVPAGGHKFKVTTGGWNPSYPGANYEFDLSAACDVKITFNADTKEIKVIADKLVESPKFELKTVTAAGDGNQDDGYLNGKSWNPSAEENMLTNHDNIWTITYDNVKAGDHQLKFVLNENWEDNKCITGDTIPVGVKTDVACESSMRNMTFHVDADESTVKLELDLTDFDYENGTGAKLTITVTAPAVAPTPGEGNETDKPEGGDGNGETGDGGNSTTPGTGDETPTPTPGTGDETPTPTPGTGDGEGNGENGDGGSTTTPGTGNETNKPEDDKNNKNDKDEAKTITIYAKVPADWTEAYLYSWPDGGHGDPAWPGVKMTASKTHAGWYEAEIPENVQNVIVNAGSDKPQTVDLKLVSGSYFIVLGEAGADGKYSAKLNATADTATAPDNKDDKNDKDNTVTPDNKNDKDDTAAPAPDSKTITIYAQVPADWAEVYLYTWQDGANGDPAWPGTKMTASKTNAGWYELTIPADTQNVIVNAGNGNPQTVDLKLVSGSNYIVVGEAGEDGKYSAKMSSAPTGDSTELVAIAAALLMAATGMVATVAGKKKFF